jgi:RNA polymerase sigma-70 factor (ECF subfamily)
MQQDHQYPQGREMDFDRFFREQQRPLERYIGARIGTIPDCEDLASEIMCQLLAYCREHPNREIHHRPLLYKIARNRLADYYEQRKRAQRVQPIEEAPPMAAPGSLTEMFDADDELRTVRATLMTIREEYREAITLHAMVGLSIREIAELMEKPEVNVRVLIFRARRALRKRLRQQHPNQYGEPKVDQS